MDICKNENTQTLSVGSKTVKIDSNLINLSEDILLSLEVRGKSKNSQNFILKNNELQIKCSQCLKYYTVYLYKEGIWNDVSHGIYEKSIQRKTNLEYFGSKCSCCRKNNQSVGLSKSNDIKTSVDFKKDETFRTTVVLTSQGNNYLNLRTAIDGISKSDLINKMLIQEMQRKPLEELFKNMI